MTRGRAWAELTCPSARLGGRAGGWVVRWYGRMPRLVEMGRGGLGSRRVCLVGGRRRTAGTGEPLCASPPRCKHTSPPHARPRFRIQATAASEHRRHLVSECTSDGAHLSAILGHAGPWIPCSAPSTPARAMEQCKTLAPPSSSLGGGCPGRRCEQDEAATSLEWRKGKCTEGSQNQATEKKEEQRNEDKNRKPKRA